MRLSGIILSGGKSSRLGFDKSLIKFEQKTNLLRIFELLQDFCSEIIISSNNPNHQIETIKPTKDLINNKGPIGGIFTCLPKIKNNAAIILSNDTPFISKKLIMKLTKTYKNNDILAVNYKNKIEPLIAIYNKRIINKISENINNHDYSLIKLINSCNHAFLYIDDFDAVNPEYEILNINTKQDYELAKKLAEQNRL